MSESTSYIRVEGLVEFRGLATTHVTGVADRINALLPDLFSVEAEGGLVTLHASGHPLSIGQVDADSPAPLTHIAQELYGLVKMVPDVQRIESSLRALSVHGNQAQEAIFIFTSDGVQVATKTRPSTHDDILEISERPPRLPRATLIGIIGIILLSAVALTWHWYHGQSFTGPR